MVIQSMISKAFPQAIVHMAENGEVAVAKAETMRYNLILMGILLCWGGGEGRRGDGEMGRETRGGEGAWGFPRAKARELVFESCTS